MRKAQIDIADKKRPGRPPEVRPEMIVQFNNKEISEKAIVDIIKQKRLEDGISNRMRSLTIYVKPEENMIYYVINETEKGEISI